MAFKFYQYKIQWIFAIKNPIEIRDMYMVLRILGPRSLTCINFLDADYKKLFTYTSMVMYSAEDAPKQFKKYMNEIKKTGHLDKVTYVEFYRNS